MGANIPDIKQNLPMSMTMAAFTGISWYIGIEVNTSLFLLFKNRRGLYFWSCALCSWGVVLQPLFIILADFGVWTNARAAVTLIYLTWLIMVVPQSWVLYSRLHLIMRNKEHVLRWIAIALMFNSVVFSIPTLALGILAQTSTASPNLPRVNRVWDRLQTTVFFTQETGLSALYIYQTQHFLRDNDLLRRSFDSTPRSAGADRFRKNRTLLWQLVYTNILVIILDIGLLGIQYADMFYLQGAFKPCVYGVKIRVEFVILNRLIKSVGAKRASVPRTSISGQAIEDSGGQTTLSGSSNSKKNIWRSRSTAVGSAEVELEHIERAAVRGARDGHSLERQDSQAPIIT